MHAKPCLACRSTRRQLLRRSLPALTAWTLPGLASTPLWAQQPPPGERPPRRDGPDRPDRPDRAERVDRADRPARPPREGAQRYSLAQAMSERAQLHTIAFSGLAFITGDFAADTFLPPGKVSDYFGFQYLRDIDAVQGGHSPAFLTRIAFNMLAILSAAQRGRLIELAREQQTEVRQFGLMRLPLIHALRRLLEGQLPPGKRGLDRDAVLKHSARLYEVDGRIALRRAEVMAAIARELSPAQRETLGRLKFGDSRTWPEAAEPPERRSLPHDIDVALMTYASEMFAWLAGSIEADTYFCPERHAMYFGAFGLKTAPAQGRQDFAISTALTGDAGADFLRVLDASQRARIEALPQQQRAELQEIAELRRRIAGHLRLALQGQPIPREAVQADARRYGELDGAISLRCAEAFAAVGQSLSPAQRQALMALRAQSPNDPHQPRGPFLYADPLDAQGLAEARRSEGFFR